ncbi:hypothetical protein CPB85DRAFT_476131 [Mucidula mucida]|nr:hypothetical protein CPB85DRAFT_476131 [Mucidula mucida]
MRMTSTMVFEDRGIFSCRSDFINGRAVGLAALGVLAFASEGLATMTTLVAGVNMVIRLLEVLSIHRCLRRHEGIGEPIRTASIHHLYLPGDGRCLDIDEHKSIPTTTATTNC